MDEQELKKYFEEEILKNTCFSTLDELLKDKTSVLINAPRALIATNLAGVWKGINIMNKALNKALNID